MKIKVNKHNIEIDKQELINEKEVNVSKCYFEFSEDYTDSMVKKALFTKDNKTYEMLINNNECDYPSEILESEGTCVLGVYAYTTENEFTRFNPTPQKFAIELGSLRLSENSQPITPSEMEQYQQALQNGLNEVNKELEEVVQIGSEVAKQGEYATKQGNYAKSVGEQLEKDKENGLFKGEKGEPGKDGKDFTYEDFTEEQLENLRGPQGLPGEPGVDGKDYVLTEADKQEIADKLNTENDERITANETYLDTITPKSSAKGELVHITDALGLPTFENKIDGNVEQETTKGYNLIGLHDVEETTINGLTFSIKNGLLKLNGTATTLVPLGNVLFNNLKETNKYRLEIFPQSGTWDNGWIGARGYIDGTQKWYQQIAKTDNTNYIIKTLTAEEFENNNRYDIFVANGSSFNNFSCYVLFKKGEDYADYEPYTNGASPNPEYPQEIEVLEGYNLFNSFIATKSEGQTGELQIEKDGTFVVSGNNGSNNYFELNQTLGELCPSLKVGDTVYLYLETTSAVKYIYIGKNWAHNNPKTITEEMLNKTFIIYGGYNQTDKIKIQISKEPNKPFVPYKHIGYKVIGKNILPISKRASGEAQGVIFTNNFDGTYTLKGTTTANVAFSIYNDKTIKLLKNNSYTLSAEIIKGTLNFAIPISVKDKDNNLTYNFMTLPNPTVKCDKDYYINQVDLYIQANTTVDCTICVQIELGDKATEIEEFKEQITYLDLKGNFVGKINDTIRDYLVTDKKKFWLVKNVGKVNKQFTNVRYVTSNNSIYITDEIFRKFKSNALLICNMMIYKSWVNYIYEDVLHFDVSRLTETEINNCIDIIKSINIEIYSLLAEPQIIDLGELPEPIKTFEGVNNIQLLANLDTEIEVKYALDVKKYFENKLASIQEQIL